MDSNDQFVQRVLIVVGITTATVLLLIFVWRALPILLLIFAGVILGGFLRWVRDLAAHYSRLPRRLALAVVLVSMLVITVLAVSFTAPVVQDQVDTLLEKLPNAMVELRTYVRQFSLGKRLLDEAEEPEKIREFLGGEEEGGNFLGRVAGIFSTTVGAVAGVLIILAISIYIAAEPSFYRAGILSLIPPRKRKRAGEVMTRLDYILRWWFAGQCLSMLVLGTTTALGLWLLGVPLALLLGLFTAVMTFIPNLGPIIAGVPAVLLALVEDPLLALYTIILFVVIQNVEGYVITPLVQRRIINMPPALIISVQILLAMTVGFMGVLLAMPLVACGMVLVNMLYVEDVLGDPKHGGNQDPFQMGELE